LFILRLSDFLAFDMTDTALENIVGDPCGGGGGWVNWDDLGAIGVGTFSITQIDVCAGWYVNKITVYYKNLATGEKRMTSNGTDRSGNGDPVHSFILDNDERICGINGAAGGWLDAIQFVTTKGRTSGWYGGTGGTRFTQSFPNHYLGWMKGRYGNYIDMVQITWIPDVAEVIVTDVVYDIPNAQRYTPTSIMEGTLVNNGNSPQGMTQSFTYTQTSSITWSFGAAIMVGATLKVTAGIPDVASASLEVSTSLTSTYTYGRTDTTTVTNTDSYTATVLAHCYKKCQLAIVHGNGKVNFSYKMTYKYRDGLMVTVDNQAPGTFTGVSFDTSTATFGPDVPL